MKLSGFVKNNTFLPDLKISKLEHELFKEFETVMENKGYQYISVPSIVPIDGYINQNVVSLDKTFIYDNVGLISSAEQGILNRFSGQTIKELKLFANNQCFRFESNFDSLKTLLEFKEIKQFAFLESEISALDTFDEFLINALEFLEKQNIKTRTLNSTDKEEGYHIKKINIEVLTKTFGWMKTHSCCYFGKEQTKRFNITGAKFTVSCTGIASPRILIPIIENLCDQ
jgi:seryl-tRNA synthetase